MIICDQSSELINYLTGLYLLHIQYRKREYYIGMLLSVHVNYIDFILVSWLLF